MEKQDYINVAKQVFEGKTREIVLNQIENFYELSNLKINNKKYKLGQQVKLTKNTFLHGIGSEIKFLDLFAKKGIINKDFELGKSKHAISYAVSLWWIKKPMLLADYVKNYSGMTVSFDDKYFMVPYGKLDQFVEKMKKVPHFLWKAESTMEIRFMPSLAKNQNQIAFIINGRDKKMEPLFENNLLNEKMEMETALNFVNFQEETVLNEFKKNRQNKQFARIGYVLFGIPVNTIEGVLVGRKFEKNKKMLAHIKTSLPNCYICNLNGKVIVE